MSIESPSDIHNNLTSNGIATFATVSGSTTIHIASKVASTATSIETIASKCASFNGCKYLK